MEKVVCRSGDVHSQTKIRRILMMMLVTVTVTGRLLKGFVNGVEAEMDELVAASDTGVFCARGKTNR
eukprot:scaffold15348_cov57-Attheya_sp.AAC.2